MPSPTPRPHGCNWRHGVRRQRSAFTLIELLAVIAIIVIVMAMALPNFAWMIKAQKWSAAVSRVQNMVWRARALASNGRRDMAVEFDIGADNGTRLWVESEAQELERIPNLVELQKMIVEAESYADEHAYPGSSIQGLVNLWTAAGGTCEWKSGYYVNFQINQENTRDYDFGDNSKQSEVVDLGAGMTIDTDPERSPNFINWDAKESVVWAGYDRHRDIRIGPSGALVQTRDPVLCFRRMGAEERRRSKVIRCTGRLVPTK